MVVDLASGDDRSPVVEQTRQRPDQPCLALPALTKEDHVVSRDDRALEVRQHSLAKSHNAGEGVSAGAHPGEQVVPQLLLHGAKLVSAGA